MRALLIFALILLVGAAKLPVERSISDAHRALHFRSIEFGLSLREQVGQLGFIAALSGFRSLIADYVFIQAHVAWERTEWGRVLLLFRQATTLQPRAVLFWDMAAWHMAWNASVAAMNDPSQPRLSMRLRAQREYFDLGRDFLERGIRNNPDRAQLYDVLGRLYRDKYHDHARAAEAYAQAATLPDAPGYEKRFAAYELSFCEGREEEAYDRLHQLYAIGKSERLPTLIKRLKVLEEKLNVPADHRIPEGVPEPPPNH